MPNKRATGSRSTVIRCPNCGEDYSVTYKRCPFCEEKASAKKRERYEDDGGDFEIEYEGDEESTSRRSGGKRLAGGSPRRGQGGGSWTPLRLAGTVISLVIIAAAIWIVATQIVPLVKRRPRSGPRRHRCAGRHHASQSHAGAGGPSHRTGGADRHRLHAE